MGFKLGRSITLKFEGALEGAEIKLRPSSVNLYLELQKSPMTFEELAELLSANVIEWNLDGLDDQPLQIETKAILANMEKVVLEKIHSEWLQAAGGVTAPLDSPSKDGEEPSKDEESSMNSLMTIPQSPLYPQEN